MKVLHLDRSFWKRDWEEKNGYERMEILEGFVLSEKWWIIEGNYLRFAELHIRAADTIIFLDLPPLLCLWRRIKRHHENRGLPRRDIPEGCTDRITLRRMLNILIFPFHGRRTIKKTLRYYSFKNIIILRSTKEVEDFLAKQEENLNKKMFSFNMSSNKKEELSPIKR